MYRELEKNNHNAWFAFTTGDEVGDIYNITIINRYETQRVKVGTKTVVDKAAWTETVVTGQKCSFCGETKTN